MTATVALVIVSFVAAIAVLAAVIFFADMMRADEACDAARAERDAALRDKAAHFEAWQAEATNLRADVAALNTMLSQRTAEVLYLRPIASAADALAFGKAEPGEWAALREAIRARKEAGS